MIHISQKAVPIGHLGNPCLTTHLLIMMEHESKTMIDPLKGVGPVLTEAGAGVGARAEVEAEAGAEARATILNVNT